MFIMSANKQFIYL